VPCHRRKLEAQRRLTSNLIHDLGDSFRIRSHGVVDSYRSSMTAHGSGCPLGARERLCSVIAMTLQAVSRDLQREYCEVASTAERPDTHTAQLDIETATRGSKRTLLMVMSRDGSLVRACARHGSLDRRTSRFDRTHLDYAYRQYRETICTVVVSVQASWPHRRPGLPSSRFKLSR